jgi:hypothetical protein
MTPDAYRALAALLRVHGESFQKLIPGQFLAEMNRYINSISNLKPPPKTEGAADHIIGATSTSSYFSHWRYHKPPRGPSAENREKTLRQMGHAGLEHSLSKNASSVWKDP